ncbi:MAG: NTP transferase domain-containing protein, partial [Pseudonocardia sp.]|nr:NTP transferase domain-containing protein [Pseudonocardia sp.]
MFVMVESLVVGEPWVDDLAGNVPGVQAAGIVLAGGRSSRMGTSKAALPWHGSTLLRRAVAVVGRVVDGPVAVVRAPGQELPALPAGVLVAEDPVEGRGPLQGIATGLATVADLASVAFVCSVDLPFLHPAYVGRVLALLDAPVRRCAESAQRAPRRPPPGRRPLGHRPHHPPPAA